MGEMWVGLTVGAIVVFLLGIIVGAWLRKAPHVERSAEIVTELQRRLDEWQRTTATQQQVEQVRNGLTNAQNALAQVDRSLQNLVTFTQNNLQPQVNQQLQQTLGGLNQVQQAINDAQQALQNIAEQGHILTVLRETTARVESNVTQLTAILMGRRSGQAGERIVGELLSAVPDDWLERNSRLGSGQVEFAIKMPGGYLIPLDSKFVTPELVGQLEGNCISGAQLRNLLNRLQDRVQEVAKYLTDPKVLGFGIAAVPDSVYEVCRDAVKTAAASHHIVIVSYSLLLPFVLSLYLMAQRLGVSGKLSEAEQAVGTAQLALQQAKQVLENMAREITSASNQRQRALERVEQALNLLSKLDRSAITLPELETQLPLEEPKQPLDA